MKFIRINKKNLIILLNLAQAYEAEFSYLTHKIPDALGIFQLDTMPDSPYVGYLMYYQDVPIGFCIANVESEIKYIAEFYIVPVMRKQNLGYQLAKMIFDKYVGQWEVRQIEGAENAIQFWRRVIAKYTNDKFQENQIYDPKWGMMTQQRLESQVM